MGICVTLVSMERGIVLTLLVASNVGARLHTLVAVVLAIGWFQSFFTFFRKTVIIFETTLSNLPDFCYPENPCIGSNFRCVSGNYSAQCLCLEGFKSS